MGKTIKLTKMSVKYLTDFLAATAWTRDHKDVFRAGQMLCDVLPAFLDSVTFNTALPGTVLAPSDKEVVMPTNPIPPLRMPNGEVDQPEALRFRAEQAMYNREFMAWCKTPLPDLLLSDAQAATCTYCLKHFSEKALLPPNEYSYRLLSAFGLNPE